MCPLSYNDPVSGVLTALQTNPVTQDEHDRFERFKRFEEWEASQDRLPPRRAPEPPDPPPAPPPQRTVGQLYADWLELLPPSKSRGNRVSQGRHIHRPFKHRGEKLVLAELTIEQCTPAVMVSWQNMIAATMSVLHPGQPLSPGTVNQIREAVNSCFVHYVRLHELADNPLRTDRVPRVPGCNREREGYFTPEELERYVAAYPQIGAYIVRHMWFTGARVSNIRRLRKHEIDWATQDLVVVTKGNKVRRISFPDVMVPELRALVEVSPSEWVYPSPRDPRKCVPEGTFQTWSRKAQDVTGLRLNGEKAVPHHLRHTAAVEMIEAGADLTEVQAQLTHSSIAHTARYARVRGAGRDRVKQKLNARFAK
jgi:integrase